VQFPTGHLAEGNRFFHAGQECPSSSIGKESEIFVPATRWAVLYFLLYGICETYCQIESQRGLVSILLEPLPRQFQLTCIAAFKQYFQLEFQYAAIASLTTMLRLYKPHDWPPMFGEWGDAWSVRRFWDRTWHPDDAEYDHDTLHPGSGWSWFSFRIVAVYLFEVVSLLFLLCLFPLCWRDIRGSARAR